MHQNANYLPHRLGLSALKKQDSFNRAVFKRRSCASQFASLEVVDWAWVRELWPLHRLSHEGPRFSESDSSAVPEGGVCLVQPLMQRQQDSLRVLGWTLGISPSLVSFQPWGTQWYGLDHTGCFLAVGELQELQGPSLSSWSPEAVCSILESLP